MESVRTITRQFLSLNRRASSAWERRIAHASPLIYDEYINQVVAQLDKDSSAKTVLDVGAGKSTVFLPNVANRDNLWLVGVDVSMEEMELNADLDEKHVADVSQHIPLTADSVDIVVSHAVLEHLPSIDVFWKEVFRVLRPGGSSVHLFPSKYAPFSIANRLLPNWLVLRILDRLHPDFIGKHGFVAHYDECTAADMARVIEKNGLIVEEVRISYYQAPYYAFLFPLYVLNVLYEKVLVFFDARRLAASVMIVARKPDKE